MKIHVAIVSDQILANLIPALMDRPDKVCLVCTDAMRSRGLGQRLTKLLEQEAIATEVKYGAPEVDLRKIHEFALNLIEAIKADNPQAELVLNATGGTKLMALGFVDMFRGTATRILYTDTAHRRIELLPLAGESPAEPLPMTHVLDAPRYLAAQGLRLVHAASDDGSWRGRAAARKQACKYFGRHAAEIQDFIGKLNGLADEALSADGMALEAPKQMFDHPPWGRWQEAMTVLVKANLLRWQPGSVEVEFVDVETARFLHGGWLEEYAWHTIKDEGAHDVRLGVEVVLEGAKASRNEFDVLACHGNELLFIECKTLRFQGGNDNEIAYKVDSLGQDARGLFGETWLLSAREPSPVLRERARQARIRLIRPGELPALRELVRAWIRNET